MKKGILGSLIVVVLLLFSGGTVAMAGIDFKAEASYDLGGEAVNGYTQITANMSPDPFDFELTWKRDWMTYVENSISLDAGISLGLLRLGYERELLEADVGVASLVLTSGPLKIGYERTLDGLDPGTLSLTFAMSLL